jgi:hypothetical protein
VKQAELGNVQITAVFMFKGKMADVASRLVLIRAFWLEMTSKRERLIFPRFLLSSATKHNAS